MRTILYGALAVALAACGFGDNRGPGGGATTQRCGDGIINGNEGCDDGNTVDGDGCSSECAVEAANPVCGNGVREVGEACDDGNSASGDGCSSNCTVESVCGNGVREAGEACDDGNVASGDGCSSVCQVEGATACGLIPQSDCPANQACDFTDDNGTTGCRPITAQGTADSVCSLATDCSAGFTCVQADNSATIAVCMRLCDADAQCGAGARCVFGLQNSQGQSLNVDVCSNACNVLAQTGCPSGLSCQAFDSQGGDFTDCSEMDGKLDGQTCTAATDCLPGSTCVTSGGQSKCREYCDLDGPNNQCAPGLTCGPFTQDVNVNDVDLGSCR